MRTPPTTLRMWRTAAAAAVRAGLRGARVPAWSRAVAVPSWPARGIITDSQQNATRILRQLARERHTFDDLRGPMEALLEESDRADGAFSNTAFCNELLERFARCHDSRSALSLVKWMTETPDVVRPDDDSYVRMLEAMRTAPRPSIGRAILDAVEARHKHRRASPELYARVVSLHAHALDENGAFDMIKRMVDANVRLMPYGIISLIRMRKRQRAAAVTGSVSTAEWLSDGVTAEDIDYAESDIAAEFHAMSTAEREEAPARAEANDGNAIVQEDVASAAASALLDSILARCLAEETASRAAEASLTAVPTEAAMGDDLEWLMGRLRDAGALAHPITYRAIIVALSAERNGAGAQQVYDEAVRTFGRREANADGMLASALATSGYSVRALDLLRQALAEGQPVSYASFTTVARAMRREGRKKDLEGLVVAAFQGLRDGSVGTPVVRRLAIELLHSLRNSGDVAFAEKIVEATAAAGIAPSRQMYEALAEVHGWQGGPKAVREVMRRMEAAGVAPTSDTYLVLLHAVGWKGLGASGVSRVFQLMDEAKVPRVPKTYQFAMLAVASAGDDAGIEGIVRGALAAGMPVGDGDRVHALIRSAVTRGDVARVRQLIVDELPKVGLKSAHVTQIVCRMIAETASQATAQNQHSALEQAVTWVNVAASQGAPPSKESLQLLLRAFAPCVCSASTAKFTKYRDVDVVLKFVEAMGTGDEARRAMSAPLSNTMHSLLQAGQTDALRRIEEAVTAAGVLPTRLFVEAALSKRFAAATEHASRGTVSTEEGQRNTEDLITSLSHYRNVLGDRFASALPSTAKWSHIMAELERLRPPRSAFMRLAELAPVSRERKEAVYYARHLLRAACRTHGFDVGRALLDRLRERGLAFKPGLLVPLAVASSTVAQAEDVFSLLLESRSVYRPLDVDDPLYDAAGTAETTVVDERSDLIVASLSHVARNLRDEGFAERLVVLIREDRLSVDVRPASSLVSALKYSSSAHHAGTIMDVVNATRNPDPTFAKVVFGAFKHFRRPDLTVKACQYFMDRNVALASNEYLAASEAAMRLMPPFNEREQKGAGEYLHAVMLYDSTVRNNVELMHPLVAANAVTALARSGAVQEAHNLYHKALKAEERALVQPPAVQAISRVGVRM